MGSLKSLKSSVTKWALFFVPVFVSNPPGAGACAWDHNVDVHQDVCALFGGSSAHSRVDATCTLRAQAPCQRGEEICGFLKWGSHGHGIHRQGGGTLLMCGEGRPLPMRSLSRHRHPLLTRLMHCPKILLRQQWRPGRGRVYRGHVQNGEVARRICHSHAFGLSGSHHPPRPTVHAP